MSEFNPWVLRNTIEQNLNLDDTPYIQRMGELLTADAIESGVALELGNDLEALKRVDALIGASSSLESGSLDVVSVVLSHGNQGKSVLGSLRPLVKQLGPTESLTLIQAKAWGIAEDYSTSETSFIQLGNSIEGDEEGEVDTHLPMIVFGANAVYKVAEKRKLAKLYREVLPNYGTPEASRFTRANEAQNPSMALKRYQDSTGITVSIPVRSYGVTVGQPDGSTSVKYADKFRLTNGRIIRRRD